MPMGKWDESTKSVSHETFEIKFEKKGFEELLRELRKSEEEQYLRDNYPALQSAWEHYQLTLKLLK